MHVILFLNHDCNLRCSYCYNGNKFTRAMDEATVKKAIDLAFSTPNARISFFGGEPLLAFEMIKAGVSYARELARTSDIPLKRFSTTVNGTLLTTEILNFFKKENFHLLISLDGNAHTHNLNRPYRDGRSSYDDVIKGLLLAKEILPYVRVSTVVDPSNVQWMADSFAHIAALGIDQFSFNFNYDGDWTEETLGLFADGIKGIGDQLLAAYRQGRTIQFNPVQAKIKTHINNGYKLSDRCKFGDGELTVAPSGRLYPCERLVGEDRDDTLCIGTLEKGIDIGKVIRLGKRKNQPDKECVSCKIADRCIHWCGCVQNATTGATGSVSGLLCTVEQAVIEQGDRIAQILFKEKNQWFMDHFYGNSTTLP